MCEEDVTLEDVCCGLKVGQKVPDFKIDIYDSANKAFGEISLEQLKKDGKWTIIVFYPADFTFVCATEFEAIAERYEEFKKLGAEVITISTDTKFVHLAWQRDEKSLAKVAYPMGADPTGSISRLFGVYNECSGLDLRGTFVINPDGLLLNSEVNFYNLGRNFDEVLRKLKANLYLAGHDSEACPAKWQKEGDTTLKPGADLVGKVFEATH
ncbi:MAG: redoxin domain-containing protein [Nitrospirae bacterium]|nr:redoxin domain-containing protein [Nitrospirota bacterium]